MRGNGRARGGWGCERLGDGRRDGVGATMQCNNYSCAAEDGRATCGERRRAAEWRARYAVIVSARHERSRDCPAMGDAGMRRGEVGVVVGKGVGVGECCEC